MDWFKHKTGSHTDPDICAAIDEFGDTGYTAFFVILEVYGREFNSVDDEGWLRVSKTFLRRKLRKSWTKVELLLNFYQTKNRIFFTIEGNDVLLRIPLFIELASTWARRKTRKQEAASPEGPQQGPQPIEVEVEVEVEVEKKEHICASELRERFETVWKKHPRKRGNKTKAFAKFKKTVKTDKQYAAILKAVENYAAEQVRLGVPEDKIQYASTWFNQWESWAELDAVDTGKPQREPPYYFKHHYDHGSLMYLLVRKDGTTKQGTPMEQERWFKDGVPHAKELDRV